jgi:hypothetical protein
MKRALVTAVGLAVVVALSGCTFVGGNPVEQIVEGVTGGEVEIGDTVPEDFPAEVPLAEGEVLSGTSAAGVWNVGIRVDGADALGTIVAELEAAGFVGTQTGDQTADGGSAALGNDQYGVVVVVTRDGEGWVANYTVTRTAQ